MEDPSAVGELDDVEPERFAGVKGTHVAVEVIGLSNVTICVEVVGAEYVRVGIGSGQDDDRNVPKRGIALQALQNFVPAQPRQVQVENNEVDGSAPFKGRLVIDEAKSLLSVFRQVQPNSGGVLSERLPEEAHIGRIVLDEQDMGDAFRSHACGDPLF